MGPVLGRFCTISTARSNCASMSSRESILRAQAANTIVRVGSQDVGVGLGSRVAVAASNSKHRITCVSGPTGPKSPTTATCTSQLYANHGTARLVDVGGAPDTPCFHAYFKPPRIRSSRGLTSFPVVVELVSATVDGGLHTTNLATRDDPTLYRGCHLS
jgi:hypothetical protein